MENINNADLIKYIQINTINTYMAHTLTKAAFKQKIQ